MTSGTHGPETLASPHGDDDPARAGRARRRTALLVAAAVVAGLAALLWVPRGDDDGPAPGPTALPPEPLRAALVLDPRRGREGQVPLEGRAVVEIECIGPGSVLVRLNARSWVTQSCAEGELRRAQRLVTARALERLVPGLGSDVRLTVSTVGTTGASRWRVSLHPPLGTVP